MKNNKLLYFSNSFKELYRNPWKFSYLVLFTILSGIACNTLHTVSNSLGNTFIQNIIKLIFNTLNISLVILMLIITLILIGKPLYSKYVHHDMIRVGIKNSIGECPVFLSKFKLQTKQFITYYEFAHKGLTKEYFKENRDKLGLILKANIVDENYSDDLEKIILSTVKINDSVPEIIPWENKFKIYGNQKLALGEDWVNKIFIDLNINPHLVLAGTTNSGKTNLLKLLLHQCYLNNFIIYIADFKGGLDFNKKWRDKTEIITDKERLNDILSSLIEEMKRRTDLFINEGVSNIEEYTKSHNLERIVFACDEIAELLDKTGVSKNEKELITELEGKLSTLARLSRAIGIHLFLSTQRPDANILNGQIKTNISYRICGKADSILSNIVLDNSSAHEMIPKDEQGLFVNQDNNIFRAYYYDDNEWL
ncbi:hypothetical protein LJB88_04735 [Erysipelotrichaceae bacterium OttesenSCG-928-M19]|nr:hypothetical protein [Erysipelotrichaceae bacterium OttesenSCG-928-M19]